MMKVYTQTWYRGNNYGSVLQAYALQHTISDMGYACSVLNYKPTKADMWKLKFINHSLKETIQYKIKVLTTSISIFHLRHFLLCIILFKHNIYVFHFTFTR